jgi:hypothetical protein
MLGIAVNNPDAELRSQLGLPEGVGLVVEQVMANSLAAKSGVKQYDVLQKINDQLVINPEQVGVLLKMQKPGEKFTMTVIRQGKTQELSATLSQPAQSKPSPYRMGPGHPLGQGQGQGQAQRPGQRHGIRGMGQNNRNQPGNNSNNNNAAPPPVAPPTPPAPPTPSPGDQHNPEGTSSKPAPTQPTPNQSASATPSLLRQIADLFVD